MKKTVGLLLTVAIVGSVILRAVRSGGAQKVPEAQNLAMSDALKANMYTPAYCEAPLIDSEIVYFEDVEYVINTYNDNGTILMAVGINDPDVIRKNHDNPEPFTPEEKDAAARSHEYFSAYVKESMESKHGTTAENSALKGFLFTKYLGGSREHAGLCLYGGGTVYMESGVNRMQIPSIYVEGYVEPFATTCLIINSTISFSGLGISVSCPPSNGFTSVSQTAVQWNSPPVYNATQMYASVNGSLTAIAVFSIGFNVNMSSYFTSQRGNSLTVITASHTTSYI